MENSLELKQAEMIVELADKGIKTIKQIETINALDQTGALVMEKLGGRIAYRLRTKEEMIRDGLIVLDEAGKVMRTNFPKTSDAIDEVTADFIYATSKELSTLVESIKAAASRPHGSKVKAGRFQGCRIVYAGTKSYIELGEDLFFYLTPDSVSSVRFVCKKFRVKLMKDYYYYEVIFKDGSESYVRASERHRENLERCNLQAATQTIFKELLSGENYTDDSEDEE